MFHFKATGLIVKCFDEHDVHYRVADHGTQEEVLAGFSIPCGPSVEVKFISRDDDNDVACRVFALFNDIPKRMWAPILRVCNEVNADLRYTKFVLDKDGDLNVEYDLAMHVCDECLGEVVREIFYRTMKIIQDNYAKFAKVLFGNEPLNTDDEFYINEDDDDDTDTDTDDEDDDALPNFRDFLRRMRESMGDDDDDDADTNEDDDADDSDDE